MPNYTTPSRIPARPLFPPGFLLSALASYEPIATDLTAVEEILRLCKENGELRHRVEALQVELAIRDEELAVFTEEAVRVAHPDDDWSGR